MFLNSQLFGAFGRSFLLMSPFSMSCGVTQCWNVCVCLPMPGGIPGIWLMSMSILYSYIPGFTLLLNASKGPAEAAGGQRAAATAAAVRAVRITEFPLRGG